MLEVRKPINTPLPRLGKHLRDQLPTQRAQRYFVSSDLTYFENRAEPISTQSAQPEQQDIEPLLQHPKY